MTKVNMSLIYIFFIRYSCLHKERAASYLLHAALLFGLFFNPEDGGDIFLLNFGLFSEKSLHNHRCGSLKSYRLFYMFNKKYGITGSGHNQGRI
jgi:hypothetical protein